MKKLLTLFGMFIIAINTYAIDPAGSNWTMEKVVLTSLHLF